MKIKLSYLVIGVLAVAVLAGGFFGYREYTALKSENQRLSNPEEAAKSEIERVKSQVSSLIEVPEGEEPTIANVVDVSKLSDQAFFKNAKNGDKLLVYQEAQKAILYRPDTNKIVEVSTISLGDEKDAKTADSKPKTETLEPDDGTVSGASVEAGLPGLE